MSFKFSHRFSAEEKSAVIEKLPKRSQFVHKGLEEKIDKFIQEGKDILFLPNYVLDMHVKEEHLNYKLVLYGILPDGNKAAVVLNGITPYCDVLVKNVYDMEKVIPDLLRRNKIYVWYTEIIQKYQFMYYSEKKKYLRLFFRTLTERKNAINWLNSHNYQTASNDLTCYYRVVAREYRFLLCGWNVISNYHLLVCSKYAKPQVKYCFELDVRNIRKLKIEKENIDFEKEFLLQDRSLLMSWDLETYSSSYDVPDPNDMKATIFMDACVFSWYFDKKPLITINLTTLPIPNINKEDLIVIRCEDQASLIILKAIIIERMAPEFIVGFNDGSYDWDFLLKRAEFFEKEYNTMTILKDISMLPNLAENKFHIRGREEKRIKIDNETLVSNVYFNVPGVICIDVRTIFRRRNPSTEETNLNYYLRVNKLGVKKEISHYEMKLYYEKMIKVDFMEDYKFADNDYIYNIIEYCNYDALSCHLLMRICNIIADKREIANISYTSLYDSILYADGMRVRNLICSAGSKEKWNIVFNMISVNNKDKRKYPGAFIVPAIKGLYRDFPDRPCAGLDVQSMYPNLIATYNISPEKLVKEEDLPKIKEPLCEVRFRYGLSDQKDEDKDEIRGWLIQHGGDAKKMGLVPTQIRKLFLRRLQVKKKMDYYGLAKEFLSKLLEINPNLLNENNSEAIKQVEQALDKEYEIRNKMYQENPISYWENKIKCVNIIREFFHSEWKDKTLQDLNEEINFYYSYYNIKQLSQKIFMNTIYGAYGDKTSPFSSPALAGFVTQYGQKLIKMVKKYVTDIGYKVLYGDTDSLYICCPDNVFAEMDQEYKSGKIDKKCYWTKMINLTMESLNNLKLDVNKIIKEQTGSDFLKMDYDEVLFPYALLGKKKYIGIPHVGIVNLRACMPDCTLAEFSRGIFIRGLELKKRGSSEFLKQTCLEIFKEAFCITNTLSFREIIENKLESVAKCETRKEWKPEMFKKTARYKLPKEGKRGNVNVLRFVERMKQLTEYNIFPPVVGERFEYVVVKRYPWIYEKGEERVLMLGDKWEYLSSLYNENYKKKVGDLEIDIDYYVISELIGQLARFIIYHPQYNKFVYNPELSEEENDKIYKKEDAEAHDKAYKDIEKMYKERYSVKYEKNKQYKKLYNEIVQIVSKNNNNVIRVCNLHYNNINDILLAAKNAADNIPKTNISDLTRETSMDIFNLTKIYISKNGILVCRRKLAKEKIENIKKEILNIFEEAKKELINFMDIIDKYIKSNENIIGEVPEILKIFGELYQELIVQYHQLADADYIEEQLNFLKNQEVGNISPPPGFTQENFEKWLS